MGTAVVNSDVPANSAESARCHYIDTRIVGGGSPNSGRPVLIFFLTAGRHPRKCRMVTVDSTGRPVEPKRIGEGAARRDKIRHRVRVKSQKLVKLGRVDVTPCLMCGTEQNLTIHHVDPLEPERFVFLCVPCHDLAHKLVYRTMDVCVAERHFCVLPEAIVKIKSETTKRRRGI